HRAQRTQHQGHERSWVPGRRSLSLPPILVNQVLTDANGVREHGYLPRDLARSSKDLPFVRAFPAPIQVGSGGSVPVGSPAARLPDSDHRAALSQYAAVLL